MAEGIVIKVGGSLYDVPDLGKRLRAWLDSQGIENAVLVPGGGSAVDFVRQADALDQLGEEKCHWLALQSLTLAAHVLAARLPDCCVIEALAERATAWQRGQVPVLDMHAFALNDEVNPGHLPYSWTVTSDSLAARVALVAGISELVLLKSCDLPTNTTWQEASLLGIVDAAFPELVTRLNVKVVNFRQWLAVAANVTPERDRAL